MPKSPVPKKNVGGRPPRDPYKRVHVLLDENLFEIAEIAWRQHRRPDGKLATGLSQYIEDLIAADAGFPGKAKRKK